MRFLVAAVAGMLTCASVAIAQDTEPAHAETTEEMKYRLEVQQARVELEKASSELVAARIKYEGTKALYESRIVPLAALEKDEQAWLKARLTHELAEIELQKTRLQFLEDAVIITIVSAKKVREENQYFVDITLRNDSDIRRAEAAVARTEEFMGYDPARLLDVDNLTVSVTGRVRISDNGGGSREVVIVTYPYQHVVPKLRYGEDQTIRFELMKKELEAVTVMLEYQDTEKSRHLLMGTESAADFPTIEVRQFNRPGRLGEEVPYDLTLNRLARTDQAFTLKVLNLPSEFPFKFIDDNGGEVTQVKFTQDVQTHHLRLMVALQEKLDVEFIDKRIEFSAFVTRSSETQAISVLKNKYPDQPIPIEELAKIRGDRVDLILIPKGKGELEILVHNKRLEAKLGAPLEMRFRVINSGTLPLNNVEPTMIPPAEWEVVFDPISTKQIDAGRSKLFKIVFTPPPNVQVGTYSPKIKVVGYTGTEKISADDLEIDISLVAERNITATLVLVGVLIGLVLVIAIVSIRISRR
ncbi:MAG: hypothetical protein CMJ49_03175 [Planctomycetaceae bacterium]|nr:hypothetical protein [Planctomycetaceae bacterium]